MSSFLGTGADTMSSAGSRDESHPDGATLASHLAGHSVGLTDLITPESSPDRHYRQLGHDDCTTDSSGNLFRTLYTQTNVAVVVTNSNKRLESSPLTSSGLFLNRHDLQDFILEGRSNEQINDLVLLNRKREE